MKHIQYVTMMCLAIYLVMYLEMYVAIYFAMYATTCV